MIILMIHSGVSVRTIQRTVLASNTDSVFRQSVWYLYLPMGSMGPYFDFVNILLGEEVCSQALGLMSLKLQASSEPVDARASREHFACFPLVVQKAVWHSSTLKFLLCFIFDNSLPVRILGGSYNGFYFQGSDFITGKSVLLSRWVLASCLPWVYPRFLSFGYYTGKNQL